jgi:hypothetical protein
MAIKLARNVIPVGFQPSDFGYQGRPAAAGEALDAEIGIVEMVPSAPGDARKSSSYFHMGVVAARRQWFVYLEWTANQQERGAQAREFMFVRCRDEVEARAYFRQECLRMQLQHRYVMQAPSRERGLPQGRTPAPRSGFEVIEVTELPSSAPSVEPSPQTIALAEKLVRGTLLDARATVQERGLIPTRESIEQLGEELLPLVVERLYALASVDRAVQVRGRWANRRSQIGLVAAS